VIGQIQHAGQLGSQHCADDEPSCEGHWGLLAGQKDVCQLRLASSARSIASHLSLAKS
jgi:hypothetical protein